MIQDQVAAGSGIAARPNCATSATTNKTSEITHTAIVGALPELLRIVFSFGCRRGEIQTNL